MRINGARLKFDPSDESLGLFFLAASGDERRAEVYLVLRARTRRGRRIETEARLRVK